MITDHQQLFVKMAISAWDAYIKRSDKLLASLTDEELLKEVAPGRNRGIYLLGHLVAVHDGLFKFFSLGDRLYPQLDAIYLTNGDKPSDNKYTVAELRKFWSTVNDKLAASFAEMSDDDWFSRHSAVTEEDFAKEPHRNKLNVLINRTNHVSYHLGQLIFLTNKKEA